MHPVKRIRQPRGVALLLVLLVVAITSALAISFLSAQGTSISVAENIRLMGRSHCVAESGLALAIAHVKATPAWRTEHPDGTWVTNHAFGDGTFTIVGQDGIDSDDDGVVEGDGSLTDSTTDPLTLTVTGTVGGVSSTHRAVVTPTPASGGGMLVYGVSGTDAPVYRKYSVDGWSSDDSGNDIGGEPRWIVARQCPVRDERAVCVVDKHNDLNLQFLTAGTWSSVTELTTSTVQVSERPFDIAYEQTSGDMLAAYRSSADNELYYNTYNGIAVSSQDSYALPTMDELRFVRLIPKPGTNEILLLTLNSSKDVCAAIWDGGAWTNGVTLETSTKSAGDEGMHAAYESVSGHALAAWSNNASNTFHYRHWDGATWTPIASGPTLGSKDPRWIRLASNPARDEIIYASVDTNKDLYVVVWDGTSWGTPELFDADTPDSNSREFDVIYNAAGTQALLAWGRNGVHNFFYRIWEGSAWGTTQTGPGIGGKVKFLQVTMGPGMGTVLIHTLNKSAKGELESFRWDGAAMTSMGTIADHIAGSNIQECFMAVGDESDEGSSTSYAISWRP